MSSETSLTLKWADGTYTFHLAWGELIQLQNKLDAGPSYILNQLLTNEWRVEYISEVIRLGLIGGGQTPAEAVKLVEYYVTNRPPMENIAVAQALLAKALVGGGDVEEGEEKAASEEKK